MNSFGRVVEHIFGCNFHTSVDVGGNFGALVADINSHLISLNQVQSGPTTHNNGESKYDQSDGRIGNRKVTLDTLELSSTILVNETFKIIGINHFGTIKTNCGVCQGKWQYEVLLVSNGVMQIGWATSNSKFGQGQGVGDTADSYAFDGSRVRKWNVSAEDYGEKWDEDDIIGCCIDLNDGCVEFYRNGASMGMAYKDIPMGVGIVYFPAVSLQQNEGLIANFGSSPFCYPVSGYHPIQDPPANELSSVAYLLDCINKLLQLMESRAIAPDPLSDKIEVSYEAFLLEIGKILIFNITPYFKIPFVVEAEFIPFLHKLSESDNASTIHGQVRPSARVSAPKNLPIVCNSRRLNTFLDLLWAFSEEPELKIWTSTLITRLSVKFQHNMRPLLLDFSPQKDAISTLHCLIRHKYFRTYLMSHILFEGAKFPWFMNIKVPRIDGYNIWETEPSVKINRHAYIASINRITSAMNSLEDMQVDLLLAMMDNTDGSGEEPSARSIFLNKFRLLRRQFYALHRVNPLRSAGAPQCLVWPFFLRLLKALALLWSREINSTALNNVPPTKFYDGSISYYDIDRLGGVLLYLLKTFHSDLEQRLGASRRTPHQTAENVRARSVAESSTSTVRNIMGSIDLTNLSTRLFDILDDVIYIESLDSDLQAEELGDSQDFLTELLDGLVLFYHISTKIYPLNQNINLFETEMNNIAQSLSEIKEAMKGFHASKSGRQQPELLRCLELSCNVLSKHLHQTAHLTTLNAAKCTSKLLWFFKTILNTLEVSSEDTHLFNFVPEYYLDCLVDVLKSLNSELKSDFVHLEDSADHKLLIFWIVQFICEHINDQRVRIAKAKDMLVTTLLEIVTTPNLVEILPQIPSNSCMNMTRFLLQPYENRAWANSNWILVRIWHGSPNSFVCDGQLSIHQKYKLKPKRLFYPANPFSFECDPCPSPFLQEQIKNMLINEPDVATSFLNSILNELNWAFSEFIGMLQELHNASNRQERVLVEPRQLKICATCFDLSLALLRVLEMVSVLAFPVFERVDQPNSYFLLSRLCQMLCQVINRASSHDGCFHYVKTLDIPGLENIDHLPVLTAVCGILLAILKEDMERFCVSSNDVPRVTKALLMEPSFQISSITFLLEDNPHLYSLHHYKASMSSEELSKVANMIEMLTHYHRVLTDTTTASSAIEEDDMCTICFAYPISATFEPCKHHSCRACITHHLMNCKNCFFCKATIMKVVDSEGQVIYDKEQEKTSA